MTTLAKRVVYAIHPPAAPVGGGGAPIQLHAAIYTDGVRQSANHSLSSVEAVEAVPVDLQAKHRWPLGAAHPSFESADPTWPVQASRCVNVKLASPPAKGDGATDDYAAIQGALDAHQCVFLPRGLYLRHARSSAGHVRSQYLVLAE